jgi:hypothetical protein
MQMEIDVVVMEGETEEEAINVVLGDQKDLVTWEVKGHEGGGNPAVEICGPQAVLVKIQQRYNQLGKNEGINAGKPPVAKGQKR